SANAGGAMYNDGSLLGASSPVLTNVTFSGNSAATAGGAMYNEGSILGGSSPALTNVILWGNQANTGTQIFNSSANPSIDHSLVQGGDGGSNSGSAFSNGTGNIDADPRFVATVDAADAPTTAGDLRLLPGSPAVD